MEIYLIRHGMTQGNKEKRYIGKTDESLCEEGIQQIKEQSYVSVQSVYVSPLKRCIETANLIFPDKELIICDELSEIDFGDFEGKNYEELKDDSRYQQWIDSMGNMPFPGGESKDEFSRRCVRGFEKCLEEHGNDDNIAFVVHGGTIMSIMESYGEPKGEYYRWQIKNGEYIVLKI